MRFEYVEVVVFGKQVHLVRSVEVFALAILASFQHTGPDDDILFVVHHGVELLRGQAQEVANFVGKRTEVPDMSHGYYEFDMS